MPVPCLPRCTLLLWLAFASWKSQVLQQLLNSFQLEREARKHQLACSLNEFLSPVKDRDWLFAKRSEIPFATPPTRKRVFGRKTASLAPSKENNVDFCCSAAFPRLCQGFQQPHGLAHVDSAHLQTHSGERLVIQRIYMPKATQGGLEPPYFACVQESARTLTSNALSIRPLGLCHVLPARMSSPPALPAHFCVCSAALVAD